jgi:hypothetical protein
MDISECKKGMIVNSSENPHYTYKFINIYKNTKKADVIVNEKNGNCYNNTRLEILTESDEPDKTIILS